MKKNNLILLIVVIALVVGLVIYKVGIFKRSSTVDTIKNEDQKEVLYWTCGMHPSVKSDKPGNCPICNMTLIPVYKEEQASKVASSKVQAPQEKEEYYGCGVKEEGHCPHCDKGIKDAKCICGGHSFMIEGQQLKVCPVCKKPLQKIEPKDLPKEVAVETGQKKILYYRNPMNPAITSDVPMKDSMGMDYIPVYEEATPQTVSEEGALSRLHLSQSQLQLAGIQTQTVSKQRLSKQIRTVGKIAYDPELAVAQEEFLTAIETREKLSQAKDADVIARAQDILDKSKFRLRLLGMSGEEIADLEKQGQAQLNLVLPEDKAWVYADVYEYELGWVKIGQEVKVTTTTYPGEEFKGIVKSISPVLDAMTRSAKVRIEVDNKMSKLKPEMYADVVIESVYVDQEGSTEILAIPKNAVLDTGVRKIVYLDLGNGTFLGKEIQIGPETSVDVSGRKEKFYPVISGLKEGDIVVTKANFLIDSQSQISGAASAAYGGALGEKEETEPPLHQH